MSDQMMTGSPRWALRSETQLSVSAADAVAQFQSCYPGAIGYAMSPAAARWVRASDGKLDPHVFELRLFSTEPDSHRPAELRWVSTGDEEGTAVTLTTQVAADSVDLNDPRPPLTLPGLGPVLRLLWGQATGQAAADGWQELADARTGPYVVPFSGDLSAGERLAYEVLEFTQTDKHGNCYVADEIICGLVNAGMPRTGARHGGRPS